MTLTLVAGAVVPVTGLVGGATAAHAASGDAELRGAEQIMALIPASSRGGCFRIHPTSLIKSIVGATAAVICDPGADGVDSVNYYLMDGAGSFNVAYAQFAALPDRPSPDEDTCQTDGTWSYNDDAKGGAKGCGDTDADTQLLWTGDADRIIGFALSTSHDVAALEKWWDTESAPLQQPDQVDFASTVRADRQAAAKKLAAQTGKSTKCKQSDADASQLEQDTLAWSWLPWLQASIECAAPDHRGPVEYFQLEPEAAPGFAARVRESTIGGRQPTKHSAECDDTRDLLGKKHVVVGQIGCYYVGGVLYAYWWQDSEKGDAPGLVGSMPAGNFTSPKKLYDFLEKNHMV